MCTSVMSVCWLFNTAGTKRHCYIDNGRLTLSYINNFRPSLNYYRYQYFFCLHYYINNFVLTLCRTKLTHLSLLMFPHLFPFYSNNKL